MRQYFIHSEVILYALEKKVIFSQIVFKIKKIIPEIINSAQLGIPESFSKIETTMELMRAIWSANQGSLPKSSHMVEILLSGTYWKLFIHLRWQIQIVTRLILGLQPEGVTQSEMRNEELMEKNVTCQSHYTQLSLLWTTVQSIICEKKTGMCEILSYNFI